MEEKHKESGSNEQSNANNLDNVTEKKKIFSELERCVSS